MRKASYIRGAAESVLSGELDIGSLGSMPDELVIKELTKLRGIGKWTAEMLLIFSLERPDVFSRDDLGLTRGLCKLHALTRLTDATFEHYRRLYSPYCSVASFYLWQGKITEKKVIVLAQFFEMCMIVCFGISWPISVVKSYRSKTAKGKSGIFSLFVWVGYI